MSSTYPETISLSQLTLDPLNPSIINLTVSDKNGNPMPVGYKIFVSGTKVPDIFALGTVNSCENDCDPFEFCELNVHDYCPHIIIFVALRCFILRKNSSQFDSLIKVILIKD